MVSIDKSLRKVEERYNSRIESKMDAVEAAGQWGSKEFVPEICEEIGKKLDIKKDDKILEIGCGSGVLGNWLAERCSLYCGLDISLMMLKKFSDEYLRKPEYNLIKSLTNFLPLRDNYFDAVVINGVTMYFQDDNLLKRTLMEIERVARDNAIIFLGENVTPDRTYWEYRWFQDLGKSKQVLAKPYIKLRLWLAKKVPRCAGKWKDFHREVDPGFIKKYFDDKGQVIISDAAAMTVKRKRLGKNWKGNRRMDFTINLRKL